MQEDQVKVKPNLQLISLEPPAEFPLGKSFKHKVRPFLDAVDRLRSMGVTEEVISLPTTIVVVGDQSSGKSSVLESLSGVELPKGQDFVTRVPIILRLKGSPFTKITIAYKSKSTRKHIDKEIAEAEISDALSAVMEELAGPGKGVSESTITLNVSKLGAPDLTLIDLPGITRLPVQDQPDNIYDRLRALIHRFIKPEETIILNVLSAAMDFSVCESSHMCREVDKLGKRTLAVVTKVDMCPDGLLEKITWDTVKTGLGYACVCNRTAEEASFEEAAEIERELFSTHSELKKLSKSMVGVEALARRLVQLQTQRVARILPGMLKQIDHAIEKKWDELEQVGCEGTTNPVNASVAFFNALFSMKSSLQVIVSGGGSIRATGRGNQKNASSSDEPQLNYTARLHQEFEKLASTLTSKLTTEYGSNRQIDWDQIDQIIQLLPDCHATTIPNMIPQSCFARIVSQLVDSIADSCTIELPSFVHSEACKVAFAVVAKHVSRFPNLEMLYTTAFQKALNQCKRNCSRAIVRLLDMEKALVYQTGSELYNSLVKKLQFGFNRGVYVSFDGIYSSLLLSSGRDKMGRLRNVDDAESQVVCSILAYWAIVSRRLADHIPGELQFSFNEALLNVADEVISEAVGARWSMEEVMVEQPEVASERQRLAGSLDVLLESKELISQVLDDVHFI